MRVHLYLISTCSAVSSLKFLTLRNFVDSVYAGHTAEQTGPSQWQNLLGGGEGWGGK